MIIDTSVVLALTERRSPEALSAVRSLAGTSVRSFVVEGELISGVESARNTGLDLAEVEMREASLTAYRRLSERLDTLTLGRLAEHFGQLTGLCSQLQIRRGQNDRWILAEALTLGEQVLTADIGMHQLGEAATVSTGRADPLTVLVTTR